MRARLFFLAALLAAALAVEAQTPAADLVLGRAVAQDVHELFKATCTECHGADLAKPKGKFGYVLDLERVASNPEYVVRGDPDKSDLFIMIRDNEMPGDESKAGNLTAAQKDLVRLWIALGAPASAAGVGSNLVTPATSPPPPPAGSAEKKISPSPVKRTVRWLGQFHPAVVHFPIALFLAAAAAHLAGSLPAAIFCLRISALTAPVAALFGWFNADFASFSSKSAQLLAWHRWLGVAAGILPIVAWICLKRYPSALRLFLILGSLIVLAAGALGGALTHGIDHYIW